MATAASAATCIKYNFIRSLFVLSCDLTHKSTKLQLVVCVCVCDKLCVCASCVHACECAVCVWLVCAVCARWLWAGYDHGYRKFFLLVMSWLTSSLSLSVSLILSRFPSLLLTLCLSLPRPLFLLQLEIKFLTFMCTALPNYWYELRLCAGIELKLALGHCHSLFLCVCMCMRCVCVPGNTRL